MILLTRLGGRALALNPDLIERAEETPDTVLTLVDGTHFVVTESLPEIVHLMREHRAAVIVAAQRMEESGGYELARPSEPALAAASPELARAGKAAAGKSGALRVVQGGDGTVAPGACAGLRRLEHEIGDV